jgi:cobalt/nickel transport system permease protein
MIVAVVATPREAVWAYAAHASLVVCVTLLARVPPLWVARRLVFELPFVLFALALPFVGDGPRIALGGMSVSEDGLWAAWNIAAKATLGLWTMIVLTATTTVADLLRGLERLHMPRIITAIAGFMVRYADVVTGELRRMSVARAARCANDRLWRPRPIASSTGALFVRAFERGERVYLAMLARGFDGSLPAAAPARASAREWAVALTIPAASIIVALAAWTGAG